MGINDRLNYMNIKDRLNPRATSLSPSPIRKFTALAAGKKDCIALTLGEPEYSTPQQIINVAVDSLNNGETHYIPNSGTLALKESISEYEKKFKGLSYSTDEIIVTLGATEALYVSLLGIINPGDEIIVPIPAFLLYNQIIHMCGGVLVPYDTASDGFDIDPEKLCKMITPKTKAIILNSPNNPTGVVYSSDAIKALGKSLVGTGIFIICDEVYDRIVFSKGQKTVAKELFDLGLKKQLLVVQSFSKPFAMTGWRMGYLMMHESIAQPLSLLHQYVCVSSPSPFQKAAALALKTDINPMLSEYKRKGQYMYDRLTAMGMSLVKPMGTFYCFPSIKKYGLSSEEFALDLLENAGVAVTPGSAFDGEGFIRLSCCYKLEHIEEGLRRIEGYLDRFK